jgi:hypothetical protein
LLQGTLRGTVRSLKESTAAPHPYRAALEARDAEALAAVLHPDVTFASPAIDVPIQGRDRVLLLFGVLATVFEEPEITDELYGEGTYALSFRLRVEGHAIEGLDYLQLDRDGRVRSIAVSMRPLASVLVLARRMEETLANLLESQSPDDAREFRAGWERTQTNARALVRD